jgi:crotonobetainyl-CoA:carnitine CoA-transferase CaiB-like acyl-CoA transferase
VGREHSGRGYHADAAQFETAIQYLGDIFAKESLAPGSVKPLGNASERGAPWGCYPCEGNDEWCVVNVRDDEEWRALRAALGDPKWCGDERYDSAAGRIADRAAIDERMAAWTRERGPREVMETLQSSGVPAGMLQHGLHQLEDPHLAERGYLRPVDQPELGAVVLEGPAFHGSDLPEPIVTPAPRLGEHTRALAGQLLGLSEAEIDDLVAKGVLEEGPPAQ